MCMWRKEDLRFAILSSCLASEQGAWSGEGEEEGGCVIGWLAGLGRVGGREGGFYYAVGVLCGTVGMWMV